MGMKAARKAITETLLKLAREDKTIFALATDSSGSVTLNDFVRELPSQFVECGIAEQDAVGIAAGLAASGLKPFVCGPASFYATRAAEQVKVDVAYSHMNVKVLGVSGGVSYGALGGTHHAVQDVAFMRAVPGLQVILPADANSAAALTRALGRLPGTGLHPRGTRRRGGRLSRKRAGGDRQGHHRPRGRGRGHHRLRARWSAPP